MQTHWRLALMFNVPGGDLIALEEALKRNGDAIRAAAAHGHVRLGVADRHPDLGSREDSHDIDNWNEVEGAVEVTIANAGTGEIPALCRTLRPLLAEFADLATVEVMTGPMFSMVPVRPGSTFLSLAFRRDPATTSAQFRDWWYNQHSGVAIPVLGEGLLAYDQVHVEQEPSRAAAAAFGAANVEYDAYDNLTWTDRQAYLHSISDPEGMTRVFQDEIGRIDNTSRRHALMREVR